MRVVTLMLTSSWLWLTGAAAMAKDERYQLSAQYGALAPNAGGQIAYSLRLARNSWEASLFSNQYLTAGSLPLTGLGYDWRFPLCDDSCFWQAFVQVGGGFSTGGPFAEVTWGTVLPLLPLWLPWPAPRYFPALRLDLTTQFIFIRYRAISWSYPLWLGVSLPF